MAWIEGSKTVSLTDYGPPKSQWVTEDLTSYWRTIKVEATTSGSTLSYTITSTRNAGYIFSSAVYINGTQIYSGYYTSAGGFPFDDKSTKTGTINIGNATSIEIKIGLCNAQHAFEENADRMEWKTVTLARTFYEDGGKPSVSIKQTAGNNTITFSGTYAKPGTNNAPTGYWLYYTTNGKTPAEGKNGTKIINIKDDSSVKRNTSKYTFDYSISITADWQIRAVVVTNYQHNSGVTSNTASKDDAYYYTSIGTGSVKVVDNGNNTFTITGSKGANGSHNTASGPTIKWGYDSYANATTAITSGSTVTLTQVNTANATRGVYAKCITTAQYGSSTEATHSLAIKQYVAPGNPGKPALTEDSYRNGRLLIKKDWTFEWTAATPANTSSPVTGYRIRLYKNGVKIPIQDDDGNVIGAETSTGNGDWYYDRDSSSCIFKVKPNLYGFEPGDEVSLNIFAYNRDAIKRQRYSGGGTSGVNSSKYTVQNAGIVQVRVGDKWVEGQVHVRAGGEWVEAQTVNARSGTNWKEST